MGYSFELLSSEHSPAHIRATVEGALAGSQRGWPCWSISNHDVQRVVSRWGSADSPPHLATQLTALVCSLRGAFCIYQGEELGLRGGRRSVRSAARSLRHGVLANFQRTRRLPHADALDQSPATAASPTAHPGCRCRRSSAHWRSKRRSTTQPPRYSPFAACCTGANSTRPCCGARSNSCWQPTLCSRSRAATTTSASWWPLISRRREQSRICRARFQASRWVDMDCRKEGSRVCG